MARRNTAAFGIYSTRFEIENAVNTLKAASFRITDISVLFPYREENNEFAHEKNTRTPQRAVAGAVVGGTSGSLAEIDTRVIPGVGLLIATGPILTALAGAGLGAAFVGTTGALIGLGIPEHEARRYASRINRGAILLSVHCDDSAWTKKAKEILKSTGAADASSIGEVNAGSAVADRAFIRSNTTPSGRAITRSLN